MVPRVPQGGSYAGPQTSPQAVSAVYVHVPFCRHRCGYCDFTLIAGRDDLIPAYLKALDREFRLHPADPKTGQTAVSSLFFGGGTPTHPSATELEELFAAVQRRFTFNADAEISIEANPLDLSDEKLARLADSGVNRISLGVQSFHDQHLTMLERDHTVADLKALLPRVQRAFANMSLDLIFGVPGQSLSDWREALHVAIDSGATHLSTYGLTIEPGTAFGVRQRRGELTPMPDELEREQYALAIDELTAAGFRHYEVSNFARPGFECRHNLNYWHGGEYHAYGPGAARYLAMPGCETSTPAEIAATVDKSRVEQGTQVLALRSAVAPPRFCREMNIRSVFGWLARIERGLSPVTMVDELSPETRARELVWIGLRMRDGVDLADVERRTGIAVRQHNAAVIQQQTAAGWLLHEADRIRLTAEGLFLADRITAEYL